jgi:hypothetical protein
MAVIVSMFPEGCGGICLEKESFNALASGRLLEILNNPLLQAQILHD